jgi:hypothetical protein
MRKKGGRGMFFEKCSVQQKVTIKVKLSLIIAIQIFFLSVGPVLWVLLFSFFLKKVIKYIVLVPRIKCDP